MRQSPHSAGILSLYETLGASLEAFGPEIYGYSWAAVRGAWWLSLEENGLIYRPMSSYVVSVKSKQFYKAMSERNCEATVDKESL